MIPSAFLPSRLCRALLLVAAALLPAGCVDVQQGGGGFDGVWTTSEHQQLGFSGESIVITMPNEPPTAMSATSCEGTYRFAFGHKDRDWLLNLTPRQPDLKARLTRLLVQPDYEVAEVNCGEGYSAYVLLDAQQMVVIHRDRDVAAVEQMTRLQPGS